MTPSDQMAIQPAWSPNSKVLAYSGMPAQGEPTAEEMVSALRQRRIWVLSGMVDNERPRALTDDPGYGDEWPQWSADGQQILFARLDEAGTASLWLVDADGGQLRQVVEKITFGAPADNFSPQIEWGRAADWLRARSIPNPEPATVAPQDDAAVAVSVPFTVCQSSVSLIRRMSRARSFRTGPRNWRWRWPFFPAGESKKAPKGSGFAVPRMVQGLRLWRRGSRS